MAEIVEIPEEVREDLMKLQQFQQQHQSLLLQKQNLELQLSEVESAMKEVDKSMENEMFEIVGNIMIKKDRVTILDSLKERKELLELRIKSIDKQIGNVVSKLNELQSKILEKMKKEGPKEKK
ncbi:prefoldin subunit beta [Nanoarchaeota archaeon]|nr:MAG: prefoldin subunit beta [Nanoarchaeota archaeon]